MCVVLPKYHSNTKLNMFLPGERIMHQMPKAPDFYVQNLTTQKARSSKNECSTGDHLRSTDLLRLEFSSSKDLGDTAPLPHPPFFYLLSSLLEGVWMFSESSSSSFRLNICLPCYLFILLSWVIFDGSY